MKPTTRYSWLHSQMGYRMVSFYSLYTRTTQKPCQVCFTGLLSTWTRKTHCWSKKRSPRRGKDKGTYDKTKGRRWLGSENSGRTRASIPPQGGSQASPRWLPRSTKSWCRSKMKESWHSSASWRGIPIRGSETSTAVFTVTTIMTRLTTMTWSNK